MLTRHFLAFAFGCIIFTSYGQKVELPVSNGAIAFQEIVELNDTSLKKQELYVNIRTWFAKKYNSSKSVIQIDDKESGRIVGKAVIELPQYHATVHCHYTIQVDVKDQKFRYSISDLFISSPEFPQIIRNASQMYSYYLKDEAPSQYRILFEGKKGFLERYDLWFRVIKADIHALVASLKADVLQTKAKDNW